MNNLRVLDSKTHGYLDYLTVAVLALMPSLLDMSTTPSVICYVVAFAVLGLSLTTAYPLGVVKAVPFPTHGLIELGSGVLFALMPWIAGFADDDLYARNFFLIQGLGLVGFWAITDYRVADTETRHGTTTLGGTYRRAS